MFLVFRPENVGIIYISNLVTSVGVCVLAAMLIPLPKKRYVSKTFQFFCWLGIIIFTVGTIAGLYVYHQEIAIELAKLYAKIDKGHELSEEALQRFEYLKDYRTNYLIVYYGIFLGFIITWFIILRLIYAKDRNSKEYENFIDKVYEQKALAKKVYTLSDKYIQICKDNDIYYESNYKIERLSNEIRNLDSDVMGNANKVAKLENMATHMTNLINEMQNATDKASYNDKIKEMVNGFLGEIREIRATNNN